MATLRVLTVSLADLNLDSAVINGATVAISLERAVSFDTFILAPTLDYRAVSDDTGILTFNILPNNDNTRYRASVTDATGSQVLDALFIMPDADSDLAALVTLSYYPDGFNVDDVNATSIQFKDNSTNLGTPVSVRKFVVDSDGLFTYDGTLNTVYLDLQSLQDAIAGFPAALSAHIGDGNNPHETTAAQVGLGNVNNTADADKPISTATQAALDDKENHIATGSTGQYWSYDKTWRDLNKAAVGLGNADNTSDADKPVSTAQQTALNLKSDLASPTFTGSPAAPTPSTGTNTTQIATTAMVQAEKAVNPDGSFRITNTADPTKKAAFSLSGIATGTTRTITVPDANVDLGNIPSSLSFSGTTLTLGKTGGGSYTVSLYSLSLSSIKAPTRLTSSRTLTVNTAYHVANILTGTINYTLPTTPNDGDVISIEETWDATGIAAAITYSGATAINVLAGGSASFYSSGSGFTSINIKNSSPGFKDAFVYVASGDYWRVIPVNGGGGALGVTAQTDNVFFWMNTSASPYNKRYGVSCSTITANRTMTLPDRDVDLGNLLYIPAVNASNSNSVTSSAGAGAIVAGTSNKVTKSQQVIIAGSSLNADTLLPEDSAWYGSRSQTYSNARITAGVGIIKGSSTGTASANLVTGSNTSIPAYLTKPTSHYAISVYEFLVSMTTTASKVWIGRRQVTIKWDGTTATVVDTQTLGTDVNPDTQTVTFSTSIAYGMLIVTMANSSAGGGDTCLWQCDYRAHLNGG